MAELKLVDAIRGTNLLAIDATMGRFAPTDTGIAKSKFEVLDDGAGVVVVRADRPADGGLVDHSAVRLHPRGELSHAELRALRQLTPPAKVLDVIQGNSLVATQVATGVFLQRFEADLKKYKIEVFRREEAVIVIFGDKDRAVGAKGHNPNCPGFEVEMHTKDLSVLRAHFVR